MHAIGVFSKAPSNLSRRSSSYSSSRSPSTIRKTLKSIDVSVTLFRPFAFQMSFHLLNYLLIASFFHFFISLLLSFFYPPPDIAGCSHVALPGMNETKIINLIQNSISNLAVCTAAVQRDVKKEVARAMSGPEVKSEGRLTFTIQSTH